MKNVSWRDEKATLRVGAGRGVVVQRVLENGRLENRVCRWG